MNYLHEQFFLMTLDPVHVGAGGNRLGRVDLSIVREPGTRLPQIPGTTLHGAIRQYAAYRYESRRCAGAGQGDGKKGHCREPQCPVCYTFGYIRGQEGGQSGVVSIGDARLLLFPVYSLAGPVWVTSPSVLNEFQIHTTVNDDKFKSKVGKEHLNLGWLMLPKEAGEFALPSAVLPEIKERAVLVSDKLFGQIVNSNLEVRTSVSIDPETGAAKEGALFTYEAIPRAAILWLDVVEDDFIKKFPTDNEKAKGMKHTRPLDVVRAGLSLAEHLGIGGMGTRGFGRVRLLNGRNGQ
jgi:CRISPR-associated protein Cmr4